MNRQDLFESKAPYLSFCDVNLPRFFSGWPYFILVLAALVMGTKVSSQALTDQDKRWAPIQHVITTLDNFPNGKTLYFGKTGEYQEKNQCEVKADARRDIASINSSIPLWCKSN
jgi:hypothetical protein